LRYPSRGFSGQKWKRKSGKVFSSLRAKKYHGILWESIENPVKSKKHLLISVPGSEKKAHEKSARVIHTE